MRSRGSSASARPRATDFDLLFIYFSIYLIRSFSRLSIRERESEKEGKKEKPIGCAGKEKKMKREKSSEQYSALLSGAV